MNLLDECPICNSDELLISHDEKTIICSECGVIKKEGVTLKKHNAPLNSPPAEAYLM